MDKRLNPLVILIPQKYVSALLKLHEKLEGKNVEWALSGDLGESLKTVRVEPDCIEIVTSKDDAILIHEAIKDLGPGQIDNRIQQLSRNALVDGVEYQIYIRSDNFEFEINEVKFKVYGDLQYKVGNWDWGDKFEFQPDVVYVVNKKTSVVPLQVKYELYQCLGWADRAEKINVVFENRRRLLNDQPR